MPPEISFVKLSETLESNFLRLGVVKATVLKLNSEFFLSVSIDSF